MKKCPPGVFCVEQWSILFLVVVLVVIFVVGILFFKPIVINNHNESSQSQKELKNTNVERNNGNYGWWNRWIPSWPYTNAMVSDPLINPYNPPLRDERYFSSVMAPNMPLMPINVPTNIGAVPMDTEYRQLGMVTKRDSNNKIMALMGRPLFTNRDKWQYYAISDQYNGIKLPIRKKGQNCMNEYGCDKLYTGDVVYVEGLQEECKITLYENNTIRYLPF